MFNISYLLQNWLFVTLQHNPSTSTCCKWNGKHYSHVSTSPGCFSGKADCCILPVFLSAWPLTWPFAASSSASSTPSSSAGWSNHCAPSPHCDMFVLMADCCSGIVLVPGTVVHCVAAVVGVAPWAGDVALAAPANSSFDGLLFWCEALGFGVVKMGFQRLPWRGLL